MAVWLKRILLGLVAMVVLLVAVVAGALALVDTAALKRVVEQQVEANTGRELVIEGELGISLFPWIGFELGSARLANAAGFDERPFAALERAELRVRLLPLLRREVAVDRVVLHGLALNLARDAAGQGNWEDLVPAEGGAVETEPEPAPAGTGEGPGFRLRIEGIELRGANLAWRDAASGQQVIVRDLDLETGPLAAGQPTPVSLSVTLEASDAPSVAMALETDATLEPTGPRLRLANLRIDLDARGDMLPGGAASASIGGDLDADIASGIVRVEPLRLQALGVIDARGRITAKTGGEAPELSGHIELAEFSPRELADALGADMPAGLDATALQHADAALAFSAAGQTVRVDDLRLRLDDTRVNGSAELRGGSDPEAALRLQVDRIDIDRYLPAGADTADGPDGAGAGAAAGDPVASLPLESMRGKRASAVVGVGRLSVRGTEARNAELRLRLDDGLLTLERLGADVAGGSLQLRGRLDGRTDTPATGLELELAGIQSAPLIRALADGTPVSGKLDAAIALDTAGPTLDDWIGALGGRIATTFSDGAIEGINIARRIRVALARFDGDKLDEAGQTRQTDFSRLHFAADVRDGVVHARELDLRAPLLRVGGSGQVDLRRRTVDYVARVLVTGTLKGQGGAAGERLKGLEIPLRIRGPLQAPEFELAFEDAMEARLKAKKDALKEEARAAEREAEQKLERELAEEKEKLERAKKKEKKKAKEKLEKELEGLFD